MMGHKWDNYNQVTSYFFAVLRFGLRCTAFANPLALSLYGFDLYSVHKLSRAEIRTRGHWVQSENSIHCAMRPLQSNKLFFQKIGKDIIHQKIRLSLGGPWDSFLGLNVDRLVSKVVEEAVVRISASQVRGLFFFFFYFQLNCIKTKVFVAFKPRLAYQLNFSAQRGNLILPSLLKFLSSSHSLSLSHSFSACNLYSYPSFFNWTDIRVYFL